MDLMEFLFWMADLLHQWIELFIYLFIYLLCVLIFLGPTFFFAIQIVAMEKKKQTQTWWMTFQLPFSFLQIVGWKDLSWCIVFGDYI
jgi:hypothetical protein